MAEVGVLEYSSETGDEYDDSPSASLAYKYSEEVCLSGPSLKTEVRPYPSPYRF